jgi:tRNA 2-thiouridine synthesizing protein E
MFDAEGFLENMHDWSDAIAVEIARKEGITLGAEHWQVLHAAREYYNAFDLSPEMRPLVKWLGQKLGAEQGKSIYLLRLFPNSPAKLVSKIAGLPKPLNCI